ncbi:glycosyltransferase domain-containing protein [Alicycliphilus denitrificans]|uniref:glycosyltransferase domain-containing protein n=1 Tax=Alicycliphilus denitrificans TaxID=179636 RepID=UPI00384AE3F6
MKKIAVYTCVTGSYDDLPILRHVLPSADYFCFNDGSVNIPSGWTDVRIENNSPGNKTARYYKIVPHLNPLLEKYEMSVWVDGNIEIVGDISILMEKVYSSEGDVFIYNHPLRNCVYDEVDACFLDVKISLKKLITSRHLLRRSGIKKNGGLFETGVMIRKHNNRMKKLMDCWWAKFVEDSSGRDQISLVRAIEESKVKVVSLGSPDHRLKNEFFKHNGNHKKSGIKEKVIWKCMRLLNIFLIKLSW